MICLLVSYCRAGTCRHRFCCKDCGLSLDRLGTVAELDALGLNVKEFMLRRLLPKGRRVTVGAVEAFERYDFEDMVYKCLSLLTPMITKSLQYARCLNGGSASSGSCKSALGVPVGDYKLHIVLISTQRKPLMASSPRCQGERVVNYGWFWLI